MARPGLTSLPLRGQASLSLVSDSPKMTPRACRRSNATLSGGLVAQIPSGALRAQRLRPKEPLS